MIVVTGGTGLVGSHLLFELASKGNRIKALKRSASNTENVLRTFRYYSENAEELFALIDWVDGDILDLVSLEDAFEGASKVYHTAAFVSFVPSHRKKILNNNIQGTANVVNACLSKQVGKLCHVSSVAALGHAGDGLAADENIIWSPSKQRSYYSVSKFHSEMEVWRGIEEGLDAVIVNPSFILGPGNWDNGSTSLFKTIFKGLKFYPPGITGFVDVRDVAKAMVQLMDSDISGERFILNSEDWKFEKIFHHIANAFGKPIPKVEVKHWMASIAWRAEWLKCSITRKGPQITRETVASGFNKSGFSSEKIKQRLGFHFIPVAQSISDSAGILLGNFKS
jgi:nucleoside-diphosphate-sugar epimerase